MIHRIGHGRSEKPPSTFKDGCRPLNSLVGKECGKEPRVCRLGRVQILGLRGGGQNLPEPGSLCPGQTKCSDNLL